MGELITKETLFIKDKDGQMVLSPDAIDAIREIQVQKKKFDKAYNKYKTALQDGMKAYGLKKVDTEELLVTYVDETERLDIDRDRLWAEHKDIAFECQKFVPIKASVRITVR